MSATAASLPCPICAHSGVFESVQSLRDRLIHVSTNKLLCPVCQEEVSGLDKLTIHLFSHVKIVPSKACLDNKVRPDIKIKSKFENVTNLESQSSKQPKSTQSKNKTTSIAAAPVKYVKIYPKLPTVSMTTVPVLNITGGSLDERTMNTEVTKNPANTICNICGLQFVDADILKMHKCLIHNIDETESQNFTRYECHLCPKNFKMRGSLMVHLRVAHFGFLSGNYTSENNKLGSDGKPIDHNNEDTSITLERNDNKQWQCDVCRKCFTTKYFLKKHKRLHTGETPYACSQCNKTFTFQQSYHKHLLYHNDEKPHTCTYCGRAFKELSTLHNHQRIHTGEKPFSCETCGKSFRQRVSYLVHRRIHTGVMPYKCTACDKSFRYKVSQRTHKCQSKPPGTVVRQTGNLLEKLKKKNEDPDENNPENAPIEQQPHPEPNYPEVSEANAELVRTGAKLSLEDMESESFTFLAENFNCINNNHNKDSLACINPHISNSNVTSSKNIDEIDSRLDELIDCIPNIDKNVPSPSEILKNLCLSKDDDYIGILQEERESKQFDLYNDINVLL